MAAKSPGVSIFLKSQVSMVFDFDLEFYCLVNTAQVMSSWSVNLLTLFLSRLSSLSISSVLCAHTFASNRQVPFSNKQKGVNDGTSSMGEMGGIHGNCI